MNFKVPPRKRILQMPKPIDKTLEFGFLNDPDGLSAYPAYDSSRTDPLARLRRLIDGRDQNTIDFTGRKRFRARVLRVDQLEGDHNTNIKFFNQRALVNATLGEKVKNGPKFGVYARVDLFDSMPTPASLDESDTESQVLIQQHTFFTAKTGDAVQPEPDDIVWVDWLTKSGTYDNWKEPVYLGPLDPLDARGRGLLGTALSALAAFAAPGAHALTHAGANTIGGGANTLPPVEAGGSIDAATVRKAFEMMKQEVVAPPTQPWNRRWRRKCLQFASYLAATAGSSQISKGARHPSSSKAWSGVNGSKIISCPKIKSSDGKRFGRGMTIKELTAAHGTAGTNTLKPGWAVHVKSSWTVDRTYSPKDDFHHWITYAGNDEWVDSRGIRSAAKQDGFLRAWFRGSYMHDDYIEMRRRTFGNKSLGQIPSKDRQPKVTAIHNPY